MFTLEDKVIAVCEYVKEKGYDLTFSEVKELNDCTTDFDCIDIDVLGEELRVLTEEERDEAWEESIQSYIDECILPELPKRYHDYFDCDKFIRDARVDGAGHSLAHYDGNEYEYFTSKMGERIYIYRTN